MDRILDTTGVAAQRLDSMWLACSNLDGVHIDFESEFIIPAEPSKQWISHCDHRPDALFDAAEERCQPVDPTVSPEDQPPARKGNGKRSGIGILERT